MRKSGWFAALQGLSYLTQVGLSMATPLILMLLLASWLTQRVGLGVWVFVPALVLGLGAGGCSFVGFARYVTRKNGVANVDKRQRMQPPNTDTLPPQ